MIHSESSRLISYNATTLEEIHNITLPGLVEGSPTLSSDKSRYTFIVSNLQNESDNIPQFRVMDNANGSIILTESSLNGGAYAPMGIGRNPSRGNYGTGFKNTNDVLVWGEKFIKGRGVEDVNGTALFQGKIHFFQLPMDFDSISDISTLASRSSDEIGKVTLAPPLIPTHGQGAIFAFQAGLIRGWSKGRFFGKSPK